MEVTTVMYDWHSTLSSFEGTSQTLPRGTFDPVREGAQQIDEVVGLVYENSDQLAARIQIILTALDNCL